jgi:TPP-dependent pyruvate/acetoin dehydrogenase alpha subunit
MDEVRISSLTLRKLFETMLKIRLFEEKVSDLIVQGEIKCPTHLYIGQEAVATGVCANLRQNDWVLSNHRNHGHYIAKGGDIKPLMAEFYGKATGCSKGRGGSMHISSPELGLPGSSAIVGGTIPIAVGAALAFSIRKEDVISVAFFGEGAAQEGVFYEALNFASLNRLPVIFVCEDNLYCTHLPISACLADVDIYRKSVPFAMPGVRVDGNNVMDVYKVSKRAVEDARRGKGPTLIECMTYRWRGHVGPSDDLDKGLRSKEELDHWMNRDPIKILERFLLEHEIASEPEIDQLRRTFSEQIEASVVYARESPYPHENDVLIDVFKPK